MYVDEAQTIMNLRNLIKSMTPDQVAEAQEMERKLSISHKIHVTQHELGDTDIATNAGQNADLMVGTEVAYTLPESVTFGPQYIQCKKIVHIADHQGRRYASTLPSRVREIVGLMLAESASTKSKMQMIQEKFTERMPIHC